MTTRLLSIAFILTLLLTGCAPSDSANDAAVATLVASALQTSEASNPPAGPEELTALDTGTVEGKMCYPSSFIPAMTLYLQKAGSSEYQAVPIAQNQSTFSVEVQPGSYTAYAWLPDFAIGGSYSQAVACGLSVDCTDHSLLVFEVAAGQTTSGIEVCDWYGQPGEVPYPPGVQPPAQDSTDPGSISGTLSYPSSFLPAQTVVAWSLSEPGAYYYVTTSEGTSFYTIANLPPGDYQVVAYTNGMAGGYSQFVPCGLSVNCSDHSLIVVTVTSGQETSGVNPQDWYAPDGAFPSNPVP